ncbi:MAG TPA: hypothetical protein VIY48_18135 [Candidatus Paceibacterota bacterium]
MTDRIQFDAASPIFRATLTDLPSYYVGEMVIKDGPDAVARFAQGTMNQAVADGILAMLSPIITRVTKYGAEIIPGASPGSDNYLRVAIEYSDNPLYRIRSEKEMNPHVSVLVYWDEMNDNYTRLGMMAYVEEAYDAMHDVYPGAEEWFAIVPLDFHLSDLLNVAERIVQYIEHFNILPFVPFPNKEH